MMRQEGCETLQETKAKGGNMANDVEDPEKECLESSSITVNYLLQNNYQTYVAFIWEVHDYSSLGKNVIYCKSVESETFRWVFHLVKAKGTLFLFLSSNDVPNAFVTFSLITFDRNATSPSITCKKIGGGLYVSEFCSRAIRDPNNQHLMNGVLIVNCTYRTRRPVKHATVSYDQPSIKSDGHDLCDDFKTLYLSSLLTDFILVSSDGKPFYVHKLVLRARSEFFKQIFDKDDIKNRTRNKIEIYAHSLAVECIVMYMYCRELRDIHIEIMMEVFNFAAILKIHSLVKMCMKFLKENMTQKILPLKDNISKENRFKTHVSDVLRIAVLHKEVEMKNECIRYLSDGADGLRLRALYQTVQEVEKDSDEMRAENEKMLNE